MALGVTLSAPEADRFSYDRAYLLGKIKVALGGRVAEELVFDEITSGAQNDLKQVTGVQSIGAKPGAEQAVPPASTAARRVSDRGRSR